MEDKFEFNKDGVKSSGKPAVILATALALTAVAIASAAIAVISRNPVLVEKTATAILSRCTKSVLV